MDLRDCFHLLLKKQQKRLYTLFARHPEFMKDGEIRLTTVELSHIWDCHTFRVIPILTRICKRLEGRLQFESLTFSPDDGRSEGTLRAPNAIDITRIRAGGQGNYQQFRLFLKSEDKE